MTPVEAMPAPLRSAMPRDLLARLLAGQAGWHQAQGHWEALQSQARRANLSARLADAVLSAGAAASWPARYTAHGQAALKLQRRATQSMRVEVARVAAALATNGLPCVLLKGTAYLVADLPPARTRVFGDIDVLVPQARLDLAENALLGGGWVAHDLSAYHQRYYRQWMHEIPPLTHITRGSIIDLHHTVVPPTSAFRVDGALLLAGARPVAGLAGVQVLQPADMVLHSAVHLFTDGEFDHGLRDLLDLHGLLAHFADTEPGFWDALLQRAATLGLQRPLWHALVHARRLLGTPLPAQAQAWLQQQAPAWPSRTLMAWLLRVALRPQHPASRAPGDGLARWLLYVRSHALRMPLRLLLPHLARKAWMARFSPAPEAPPR